MGAGPPRAGPLRLRAGRPLRRLRHEERDVRGRPRAALAPADAGVGEGRRGREAARPRDGARSPEGSHRRGCRPLQGPDRRLGRRERGPRRGRHPAQDVLAGGDRRGLHRRRPSSTRTRRTRPPSSTTTTTTSGSRPSGDAAVRLVQGLKAKGLRVDGIGEQGHWGIDDPPLDAIDACLAAIRASGTTPADHRARHGRAAARPRDVGRRPVEEGDDQGEDQHLPGRAAAAPCRRSWRAATRTCSRCS